MAETDVTVATQFAALPALSADPQQIAQIESGINLSDRSAISVYGDKAQQAVTDFADRILSQVRNKDVGEAGKLLTDILLKAKNLDPAALKDKGFLGGLFGSLEARLAKFREQFQDVAGQIDRIGLQLDQHKDTLRRDIAILDDLYAQTQQSILKLDAYVQAGKSASQNFRQNELPKLQASAAGADAASGSLMAQAYQDAVQAVDRLEKRVFYLQQARQLGIQQLPQIRIIQAGDETLIENLQATSNLAVPAWKQKMLILLGLSQQQSALELQKTVTDATNKMIREASRMMKDQAVSIEEQSQRGIIDIDTLAQANRDLIDTVTSVLAVQEEGRKKRAEAETQMQQMTMDLKTALTQG